MTGEVVICAAIPGSLSVSDTKTVENSIPVIAGINAESVEDTNEGS